MLKAKIPFFLSSRSILRGNKATVVLTIVLMALAFTNLGFINSLLNGMVTKSTDQVIDTLSGNITLQSGPDQEHISNVKEVEQKVLAIDRVQAVTARTPVSATITRGNREVNFQVLAVDPEGERQVSTIADNIVAGEFLSEDDMFEVILGQQIVGGKHEEFDAYSLKGAEIGDTVQIALPDGKLYDFRVKGIFDTQFVQSDIRAFIPENVLYSVSPSSADTAKTILVRLDKRGDEAAVISEIRALGLDVDMFTWEESAGLMKSVSDSFQTINAILTSIGLVVAGVTVFIVIYVDVIHKRRQIGILRAIGIKAWVIWSSYVLQAIVFSLLGICLGFLILHFVLKPYFIEHPFHFPLGEISLVINESDTFVRGALLIAAGIIAGLVPSWRVTKEKLLDAIWGT